MVELVVQETMELVVMVVTDMEMDMPLRYWVVVVVARKIVLVELVPMLVELVEVGVHTAMFQVVVVMVEIIIPANQEHPVVYI